MLQPNVWHHLVITYSSVNAVRLWINGTLVGNASATTHLAVSIPNILILGTSPVGSNDCAKETVDGGQFYGTMDEFQVFSRELDATEIHRLATPEESI